MIRCLLVALLLGTGAACAQNVSFGIFGDLPYNRWERDNLPALIGEMNEAQLDFVIHVGDIKSGASECADATFAEIRRRFDESAAPLIYLPGDNDWTDCHRWSNGGYDPLERLNHLRGLFFTTPMSLGQRRIALLRQERYPENVRWRQGPLTIVTLNIQGSRNNYFGKGSIEPSEEFLHRDAANRVWLDEGFAAARKDGSRGMVIAIQANPDFDRADNAPYRRFIDQLREQTLSFPGAVLLVHGDTHKMRVDQPLKDAGGRLLANFTRLETFGSPHFGWVKVDTGAPGKAHFDVSPRRWNPSPAFQYQ